MELKYREIAEIHEKKVVETRNRFLNEKKLYYENR